MRVNHQQILDRVLPGWAKDRPSTDDSHEWLREQASRAKAALLSMAKWKSPLVAISGDFHMATDTCSGPPKRRAMDPMMTGSGVARPHRSRSPALGIAVRPCAISAETCGRNHVFTLFSDYTA